jgi:small subunit ribosomal protein S21
MSEIKVNPDESFDVALKKFNRRVQQDGILSEARRRARYESPQDRRKRKAASLRRKLRRAQRG